MRWQISARADDLSDAELSVDHARSPRSERGCRTGLARFGCDPSESGSKYTYENNIENIGTPAVDNLSDYPPAHGAERSLVDIIRHHRISRLREYGSTSTTGLGAGCDEQHLADRRVDGLRSALAWTEVGWSTRS